MDKWEYKVFTSDAANLDNYMKIEGDDGWEAYAVTAGVDEGGAYFTIWFKRKIAPYDSPIKYSVRIPPIEETQTLVSTGDNSETTPSV